MLKVLHISKFYFPHRGGIESFVKDLVSSTVYRRSVDAHIVFSSNRTVRKNNLFGFKVNMSIGKQPVSFAQMLWIVRNMNKYEVIHFHYPNPLLGLLLLVSSKPLIIHWHSDIVVGGLLKYFNLPFDYLLRRKANKIIGTSPNYVEFSPYLRKFTSKVKVIPIGIDLSRLVNYHAHHKLPVSDKLIHLLCVGRLTEYKGFKYVVSAMRVLPENYVLDIVGGGEKFKELESLILKFGLENRVRILKDIDDAKLAAYYRRCSVFVLPSITRNEAFGIVQLEAFFYNKPVVSTAIQGSGVSWVNKHNETGLIINPRSENELVEAILTIANSEKFGIDKNSYVKEFFDIEVVAGNIIALYEEL